ncbi:MarR family transcriptional regulator [Leptospira ellisii]|uniref:MarR family transcriptional regulator n=2 Tax=Leptospira ellisii TaxID=2023197 RepID=A0A2N0BD47_9LEPT|nr:MarR family transcriptional regulator [Leptospira ellisii]MDV6236049.1 MarR family transcriptional regulator [Leptospira ellisii]PJZ94482.1 MarR family transcriptional regulator [Leptospira ellisii]
MGTHYKGNSREKAVLNTFIKLSRCSDSIRQVEEKVFTKYGLTTGQFGCLETLFHIGPMCQKDIGQKIFSCEGNITQIVDNLEKRKLVKRVRSEEDRRYIIIHLTPDGISLIQNAFPEILTNLVHKFDPLTEKELHDLGDYCKEVGLNEF